VASFARSVREAPDIFGAFDEKMRVRFCLQTADLILTFVQSDKNVQKGDGLCIKRELFTICSPICFNESGIM